MRQSVNVRVYRLPRGILGIVEDEVTRLLLEWVYLLMLFVLVAHAKLRMSQLPSLLSDNPRPKAESQSTNHTL